VPACPLQEPHPALAVLEGPQFRHLVLRADGSTDLDAFAALWPHLRVMARCTPADKYTLVQVNQAAAAAMMGRPARLLCISRLQIRVVSCCLAPLLGSCCWSELAGA
jgi:hypothetical protein